MSFTPITDTSPATALAMAQKILESETRFTLISAQYTGAVIAASTFDSVNLGSANGKPMTLDAGVLLTSGTGQPASSNTSSSSSTYNYTSGDTRLDTYAAAAFSGAGTTQDAAILEFSFTVAADDDGSIPTKISLDFMFGSDEYPEFSDSSYVDIAAIEVDGVNYAYFNQDHAQPLSVIDTNLAAGNFVDNTAGVVSIEYDGISTPLRITASLASGVTAHTVRIAIADTGDNAYDSGIFVSNLKRSNFDTLPDGIYIDGDVIVIDGEDGNGYYGSDDDDTIEGGDGDDTLEGGDGNDTLDGGIGADTIIGSDGNDTIDAGIGNDSIEGGAGDDTIAGGDGKDTITGGAGDDDIDAGTGDDTIVGGAGNDTLVGGVGKDRMEGGSGADTYYVDNKKDVVFEADNEPTDGTGLVLDADLGSIIDSVVSSVKYTLTNYVENLTLAESTAKLAGTGNALGNEILGNSGANKISGMDGADTIDGGAGADKLAGGSGADTFRFTDIASGGADAISDFADEDTILFDTTVFTGLVGASAETFVLGTEAVGTEDRLIFSDKGGALYYDADGLGGVAAVKIVAIKGADAKTIDFTDFSFA